MSEARVKTNEIRLRPNAKINIGLFITGKRPDGYHELETVFYPIALADGLLISHLPEITSPELILKGITLEGSPEDNLCLKAYRLIQAAVPELPAVRITLTKNIPAGAGLGGGSSDAAHVLLGLNKLFDLKLSKALLHALAARLGADVPFFLENQPRLATGIGDRLEAFHFEVPGKLELVTPGIYSDTAQAYRELKLITEPRETNLRTLLAAPIATWRERVVNDFEPSVFARYPELVKAKQALYDQGAIYASMSGSGSALYGIFL